MNKPTTSKELELRSDYQDVRRGNCDKGGKGWLVIRRFFKKKLHKALRIAGKHIILNA